MVLNAKSKKSAIIQRYSIGNKKLLSSTDVYNKPITALAISQDGEWLAFGTSDLAITIVSSQTLKKHVKIPNAHGFPVTCIDMNASNSLVVSGSADGTCSVSSLVVGPSSSALIGGSFCFSATFLVVAVFVVIIFILGLLELDSDYSEL